MSSLENRNLNKALGANVKAFGTKKQNEIIDEVISEINGFLDGTGDISANDVTVSGTATFNGPIVLGDAAADSLTINATTSYAEPINYDNATGITAFATGGQASATALTAEINNVTTCATAGDSVKLPAAVAGKLVTVKNSGATALDIFPASSDSIDALAVNLAVRIQPGSVITFRAKDATVWESDKDQTITLIAPTTNKGQLVLKATDSTGNTPTTITNAAQTTTAVMTIPDTNGNADFVMTAATQSIGGAKTFSTAVTVPNGTVGTPGIKTTTTGHGLYEISATQLGVSVAGALGSLFDTSGIKADSVRNRVALGTAGTNCTAVEYGDGRDITTVITLTNVVLGAPTAGGNSAHGALIYTFPAGAHLHEVSYMSVGLTVGTVTTDTPDVGVGSVIGAGAVAVLGGTATFEDYITGQTAADCAGTPTVKTSVATAGALTGISINEAASVKAVHLNAADGWDAGVTGNLTATGTVTLKWTKLSA